MRAGHRYVELEENGRFSPNRTRWREPCVVQLSATIGRDPIRAPGHSEAETDLDWPIEHAQSILDGGTDQVQRRTTDKGRQELDADPGRIDLDPFDHSEVHDGHDRELRVEDLAERLTDRGRVQGGEVQTGPRTAPRDGRVQRRLGHHVTPGSARRTVLSSVHNQRKASP